MHWSKLAKAQPLLKVNRLASRVWLLKIRMRVGDFAVARLQIRMTYHYCASLKSFFLETLLCALRRSRGKYLKRT